MVREDTLQKFQRMRLFILKSSCWKSLGRMVQYTLHEDANTVAFECDCKEIVRLVFGLKHAVIVLNDYSLLFAHSVNSWVLIWDHDTHHTRLDLSPSIWTKDAVSLWATCKIDPASKLSNASITFLPVTKWRWSHFVREAWCIQINGVMPII